MSPSDDPLIESTVEPTEDRGALRPGEFGTAAVIDIGSNAIRMVVADILEDGQIEILERLQRAVRMGQDTFRRGRIGAQSMRAAIGILRDYKRKIDVLGITRIRAVATSAVREAMNVDVFVDRVYTATGLNVEVISMSEECRLAYTAVSEAVHRQRPPQSPDESSGLCLEDALQTSSQTLIVEVGGGSTVLSLLKQGKLVNARNLRLGAIRLRESLSAEPSDPKHYANVLNDHIENAIRGLESQFQLQDVETVIAIGGDARFVADQMGEKLPEQGFSSVRGDEFRKLIGRCSSRSLESLAREFGLPFEDAETLVPALLVLNDLLKRTSADKFLVSDASMRDGLLLDLARRGGQDETAFHEATRLAALALGEKFRVDPHHGRNVATLATSLFDAVAIEHGLGPRERLLLEVAGIVHESGSIVSEQARHKHTYHLIAHSEIFGLSPGEVELTAHVARYHRRSRPKPSHREYVSLTREKRVLVCKLAAILRVADAIQSGHPYDISLVRFRLPESGPNRTGDTLLIEIPGAEDAVLERQSLDATGDLFEDIYGLTIQLVEPSPDTDG